MRRRDGGKPLRSAMAEAGLSIPALARATVGIDPDGRGISQASVGQMVSTGKSGREHFSERAAQLAAEALGRPVAEFFTAEGSTSTRKTSGSTDAVVDMHEPMIKRQRLADLLGKSPSWVDDQRREYRDTATPFPTEWVGGTPRFFYTKVLAWLETVRQAA
ncbi:hypothetical protein ABH931_006080 [Streptacidiphilus sp. MAP12-33]|uniref:helix-turn-helix domain-containing protein n=1 Tax=Streptacidiphilus sp. MAP12-33 TaxID=3156266 RepID=UPI0035171DDD